MKDKERQRLYARWDSAADRCKGPHISGCFKQPIFIKDKYDSHSAPSKGGFDDWIQHSRGEPKLWNKVLSAALWRLFKTQSKPRRSDSGVGPTISYHRMPKNKQTSWPDSYNSSTHCTLMTHSIETFSFTSNCKCEQNYYNYSKQLMAEFHFNKRTPNITAQW